MSRWLKSVNTLLDKLDDGIENTTEDAAALAQRVVALGRGFDGHDDDDESSYEDDDDEEYDDEEGVEYRSEDEQHGDEMEAEDEQGRDTTRWQERSSSGMNRVGW